MQQYHPDASGYFKSLDAMYYSGGRGLQGYREVALEAHKPRTKTEMDFREGDTIISSPRNHWNNGSSKGRTKRSEYEGMYPSYKVEREVKIAKMPIHTQKPTGTIMQDPES